MADDFWCPPYRPVFADRRDFSRTNVPHLAPGRLLPATAGTGFFAGRRRQRAESRERRVTRPQQGL